MTPQSEPLPPAYVSMPAADGDHNPAADFFLRGTFITRARR
jgi:hypothetical protein